MRLVIIFEYFQCSRVGLLRSARDPTWPRLCTDAGVGHRSDRNAEGGRLGDSAHVQHARFIHQLVIARR
jgi:hypothetical protein